MVDFSDVPAQTLVPFTWVEIANQALLAGPSIQPYKALLIGQRLVGGTVAALVPTLITSPEQAYAAFGAGSQLSKMAAAWFKNNRQTELWAVAMDDAGASVASTATLTLTGTATATGTLAIYLAGQRFEVAVTSGDTATVVGDSIVAALPIDAIANAANAIGVVTFTTKNKGAMTSGMDVRTSYARGEEVPAGLTIVEVDFSGGSGSADVDDVWPTIPSIQFNVIAVGDNAATTGNKLDTELGDRWKPDRTLEGVSFIGLDNTVSNQATLAGLIDSKFVIQVGTENMPSPWYELSTACAAIAAKGLSADPARPLQTLQIVGILAPADTDRWTLSERDTLLANGVATVVADTAGRVRVERMVTTYLTNDLSAPDTSFRDVQTGATLSFMRYDLRTRFAAKFPRHKLANDGVQPEAGQAVVTPAIARAFLVGVGDQWVDKMILEDPQAWRDNLIVVRNAGDPNRLDIRVAPDLVNQLRVTAARIEFFV